MKKVLVLGGTGFVGTQVCEKLLRQGWHVTVPTRQRSHAQHLQPLSGGLTLLELDVHDEAALTQAVAGHDAVVNLVAILHGDQAAFDKVHVALPQKLARACRAAGVKRVVHISALGADAQNPQSAPSMYLRSKGQGEAVWLQAAGAGPQAAFDLTIFRPSVMFGAQDKFLNVFARLQKVLPFMPLACAGARFQPVWVDDVASAVVKSLAPGDAGVMAPAASPRTIEACGPEVFTLKQLVQLSAQLSGVCGGRGRPVVALPRWLGHVQAALMALAPGEPVMSRDNLDSMQVDNVASGALPGLQSLGITPSALRPIAQDYLNK
jgi:uncharacterized protein YbjT (DUF2867 family)